MIIVVLLLYIDETKLKIINLNYLTWRYVLHMNRIATTKVTVDSTALATTIYVLGYNKRELSYIHTL